MDRNRAIMTEVAIRQAKESDWQSIQALNVEVFENSKQWDSYLNLADPYTPESVVGYKKNTTDSETFCMIAEIDDKPVGYLVGTQSNYSYRTNKRGEINHMGVSPSYRSHGVGTVLINAFKEWCKARGLTHIAANTYFKDEKARHFYEKNGLMPIDVTLEGEIKQS